MDTKTIKAYLDADGCVTQMPSKKKKKLCVLAYLADRIPEDREYTEREFNEVLNGLHTFGDAATLRREMYDYFLTERKPVCGEEGQTLGGGVDREILLIKKSG